MKDYTEIDYRDIAKMLASALPVEGEDFRAAVEIRLAIIRALPAPDRLALKQAYWFSKRVPRQEREDLFQELALYMLGLQTKDAALAYTIARGKWVDWWRAYSKRQHLSLDLFAEEAGPDGDSTLAEHLVGAIEYQTRIDGDLDGRTLWESLPDNIKPLVAKRLAGKPLAGERRRGGVKTDAALSNTERTRLNRFVHSAIGHKLLLEHSGVT